MNTNPPADERLYDTAEVAAMLHITPRKVARLRQAGKLGCVRITGSAVRHTRAQVDAFIAAHTVEAVAPRIDGK